MLRRRESLFAGHTAFYLKGGVPEQEGFPGESAVKNPSAKAGDTEVASSIPGLGRSPGGGNGNPLHSSCLGNPMERGATAHVGSQRVGQD